MLKEMKEKREEEKDMTRRKGGRGGYNGIIGFIAMRVAADTVGVHAIGGERMIDDGVVA
jgi:hypothetical protein